VQTIAISAGGATNSESLAWALGRRTFHRIIHLNDASLDKADFMTVGMVLAEVARRLQAKVVIAGEHSDQEGQGLVPAALAQQLRAPVFSRVHAVDIPSDGEQLEIAVSAGERLCALACSAPAVLVADASLVDKPEAPDSPSPASEVETMTLAQLDMDASRIVPRPELLGLHLPIPGARRFNLTPDEAARLMLRRR
jgi:electron transfer flavoprotein alpha/beta subunit